MPPFAKGGMRPLISTELKFAFFFIQSVQVSDVAYESLVTSIYVVHAHVAHTGILNCMKTKAISNLSDNIMVCNCSIAKYSYILL